MDRISFSQAHDHLEAVMDKVVRNRTPIAIGGANGREGVVVVPAKEWASIAETLYLLRSPANARELLEAIRGLEAGEGEERALITP